MAKAQAADGGVFGDVPAKDIDRIFDGFFNVAGALFKNMTPQEIADQIEMLDADDTIDTFKAVTNLPLFVQWAKGEGRQTLFDLVK